MPVRVGINGLGRIGRSVLRAIYADGTDQREAGGEGLRRDDGRAHLADREAAGSVETKIENGDRLVRQPGLMGRWLGLGDQARVSTAFLVAVLSILGILAVELASGTRMSTGTTAIEVLGFIAAAALLMARRH